WPGNVRELENTLKNSLVRVKGQVLLPEDIQLGEKKELPSSRERSTPAASEEKQKPAGPRDLDSLMHPVFEEVLRLRSSGNKEDAFDLIERCLVREALVHVDGNQAQAAKLLGITRSTLRKRMAKYGIQLRTNVQADATEADD
ncbi:hypothetical protein HYR69_03315, partial [Candidatus Sumerlaeota bacterium]|nr:hypothetical protein [Candidatus Sumerlaeota bacterium]